MRTESDLDVCEQLCLDVHQRDGYPRRLPDDLRRFMAWPNAICAWVAELDGEVVGHVALHASGSPEIMDLTARMTGQPVERFGVVARLLVSPHARRNGLGRSLLLRASGHAVSLGLVPLLEVTTDLQPAIDLYEDSGWLRVGKTSVHWRSTGDVVDEYAYVAPSLDGAPALSSSDTT